MSDDVISQLSIPFSIFKFCEEFLNEVITQVNFLTVFSMDYMTAEM